MNITKADIEKILGQVVHPEFKKSLIELELIRDIEIIPGAVKITLLVASKACTIKDKLAKLITDAIKKEYKDLEVKIEFALMTSAERAKLFGKQPSEMEGIKKVKHIIAVASGKGGVGKTTVSVNLAISMSKMGLKVGILDADMHGPDIPIMLGIKERPVGSQGWLLPVEKYGIKVMSTGMLAGEGVPIVWRGPMVNKAIKEFLGHVKWAELDCLVVDLPPGTGDAAITLVKSIPLEGAVIVTTPQKVAMSDVRRSIGLFVSENIPILGIIENMSYLKVKDGDEEKIMHVFGKGAGEKMAKAFKVELLGQIPLDPSVGQAGDEGKPVTLNDELEVAKIFMEISKKIYEKLEKGNLCQTLKKNIKKEG